MEPSEGTQGWELEKMVRFSRPKRLRFRGWHSVLVVVVVSV